MNKLEITDYLSQRLDETHNYLMRLKGQYYKDKIDSVKFSERLMLLLPDNYIDKYYETWSAMSTVILYQSYLLGVQLSNKARPSAAGKLLREAEIQLEDLFSGSRYQVLYTQFRHIEDETLKIMQQDISHNIAATWLEEIATIMENIIMQQSYVMLYIGYKDGVDFFDVVKGKINHSPNQGQMDNWLRSRLADISSTPILV